MLLKRFGEVEQKLIDAFWPGPLTIVFKKSAKIPEVVTAGLETVAVRMPANEIAMKLLKYADLPIAAPSANVSGRPSGTCIKDIKGELEGKVNYIIDAGAVEIGLESTVVKVENDVVYILRPGKVTKEKIEELGLATEVQSQVMEECKKDETPMSPGMKYRHYAPETKCVLVYSEDEAKLVEEVNRIIDKYNGNVLVLAKNENLEKYDVENKMGMGDTLEEIAKNIFTLLRKVDSYDVELVVIEGVKSEGLGLAIMNRLIKACDGNFLQNKH